MFTGHFDPLILSLNYHLLSYHLLSIVELDDIHTAFVR